MDLHNRLLIALSSLSMKGFKQADKCYTRIYAKPTVSCTLDAENIYKVHDNCNQSSLPGKKWIQYYLTFTYTCTAVE